MKRKILRHMQKMSRVALLGVLAAAISVGGMSEGQIRKVWRLMYDLKGFDKEENTASVGERLCGIIKRELKIDAQSKEPFVWLTYQNGSTLIERLKKYVENAEKRSLRGG